MAQIPDTRTLRRASPSGQAPVARIDTSQAGAGAAALGGALGDVTQVVREELDAKARYQSSRAQTKFLTEAEKAEREFRQDPDYETFDDRYTTRLSETVDELANEIEDPWAREEFLNNQRVNIERGRTRIQDLAWRKEVDSERRFVETKADEFRTAAIETGDFEAYSESITQLFNDAADAGYFSQEEVGGMVQNWRDSTAQGFLEVLPDERRLEVLRDPDSPAANLPPDTRARLIRQAQQGASINEATRIVDEMIFERGLELDDMLREVSEYEDIRLREAVENRFIAQKNRMENAESDQTADNFNRLYRMVRFSETEENWEGGEPTVRSIKENVPGAFNELSVAQVRALEQAEALRAQERNVSEQSVIDQLYVYEARGDWRQARQFLLDNANRLSAGDYDKWSQATAQAEAPPEIKSILSAQQQIKLAAEEAGIRNDQQVTRLTREMDEWFQSYQSRNNGKEPDAREIQQQTDFMLMRVRPSDGWFSPSAEVFRIDDITELNPQLLGRLREDFIAVEGREPTESEITDLLRDLTQSEEQ